MQEWYLGWEKVPCLERCPQFRSVLIERERGSTVYQKFIDVTLFLVNSVSEFSIIVQFDKESKNCSELLVSYNKDLHHIHTQTHHTTHTHTTPHPPTHTAGNGP